MPWADLESPILQKMMQQMHRKDGASVRPKVSLLEKAIRDLEKMVAECKYIYRKLLESYSLFTLQWITSHYVKLYS